MVLESRRGGSDRRFGRTSWIGGLSVLVVGCVAALLVGLPLRDALYARARDGVTDELTARAARVAKHLEEAARIAERSTRMPGIRERLEIYNRGLESLESLSAHTRPELRALLERHAGLVGISRHDHEGARVVQVGRPVPATPWPVPARFLAQAPLVSIVRIGNLSFLAASAPIMGWRGDRIGTDVLLYDLTPLQEDARATPAYARVDRYILGGREEDRWWNLLVPAAGDGRNAIEPGSPEAAALERASAGEVGLLPGPSGGAHLIASAPVGRAGWALALPVDRGRLYGEAHRRLAVVLLMAFGVAVMGAGIVATWLRVNGRPRAARAERPDAAPTRAGRL